MAVNHHRLLHGYALRTHTSTTDSTEGTFLRGSEDIAPAFRATLLPSLANALHDIGVALFWKRAPDGQASGCGGRLDAAQQITKSHPRVAVIILSMYSDEEFLIRALTAGAKGYLLKDSAEADVLRAVHAVAQGRKIGRAHV